jgi:hypothetical protein
MVMTLLPAMALAANAGPPLACDMRALTGEQRAEHATLARQLFTSVLEQKELPNGYAFRLAPGRWLDTARWADLERRCCPFFAFELSAAADGGALWLRITGQPGVKAFMKEELGL